MLLHDALSNIGRQLLSSMSEMRRIFCCLAVVSVLLATDPLIANAAAQRRYRRQGDEPTTGESESV